MNRAEFFAAEEMAGIRDAEQFLADFRDCWPWLSSAVRPHALRQALHSMTIVSLANPLQAEIVLEDVALAAWLPRVELRQQIRERVEFFARFHKLHQREPRKTVEVLCNLILS
jgi:hypothetical protein